jgi:hypothetical protein
MELLDVIAWFVAHNLIPACAVVTEIDEAPTKLKASLKGDGHTPPPETEESANGPIRTLIGHNLLIG